ncbi:TonB-dependent receptor plug domain-containing protein [Elongatibacter sediminis]|uniref:TonB-dependent receptor n=1 Tax=Elongatibacter sediminis TaxID=3119006 RepID=A0AAW9RET7_9GAMM
MTGTHRAQRAPARYWPLLLLSLACGGTPAVGAEPAAGLSPPVLETVHVTATRRFATELEVAEAVTLIDADGIARQAPGVLAEMLSGQPGTYFQQTTPGQGIPIIRGLKGSEVLHLVDGMRLNNAFFRNAPNQYLALVDAFAVERMEVVRGSAPSLHGADAMGGVLQILTPEPTFDSSEWQAQGRAYLAYRSADDSVVGRAEAAAGNTGQAWSGGVTWQRYGDRSVGGGDVVGPTAHDARSGDLKWRGAVGTRGELMFSAQVLEQPSTPRVDELVAGFGQDHPSSAEFEFQPNRRSFLHARYRLKNGTGWYDRIEIHLARQIITDDRLTREFGSTERIEEANESTLDGMTVQINSPWAGGRHELVWGLEYYTDEVDSSRVSTDIVTGVSEDARGRFPDGSTMDSAAVYAANRWDWDRFMFEAGLRYSRFDVSLPAAADVEAVSVAPDDLTGDIHAAWELAPGWRLVSNIGRGFRAPNIFDLGTLGPRPGNRFNAPNPDLKPETVWSYDLGLKASGGSWQAELFVFYSDYRDKISSVLTGVVRPDGRLEVRSENLLEAELYGIESGFRWRLSDTLESYGALNWVRGSEDDSAGNATPADRVPPLNGRLGLVWEPADRLRLESWFDFASAQNRLSPRDESDPRINPDGTPGYGTLNVLLGWQADPRLELGVRLENLGDKRYREHGSGIDASGRSIGFWMNALF